MKKKKSFLKKFDTEKEMDDYLESSDLSKLFFEHGVITNPKIRKINLDLPEHMIAIIDFIAKRIGVSRQPLLKIWLSQMIKKEIEDQKKLFKN